MSVLGQPATILVCQPSQVTQAPCPSGQAATTMTAYVIDPASASQFEAQFAPFDYLKAGTFWASGFTSVIALFLVARAAGSVLHLVRRG